MKIHPDFDLGIKDERLKEYEPTEFAGQAQVVVGQYSAFGVIDGVDDDDVITKMVDRRLEIKRTMKRLEEELAALDEELMDMCDGGEIILGSEGRGYILSLTTKKSFPKHLFEKLPMAALTRLAKLTAPAIDRLAEDKLITKELAEALQSEAIESKSIVIRDYVPDEAKIRA